MLMAPQYGNKHGTLAIEPVSTRIVHKEVWEDFKVSLAKVWMSYTDNDGSLLKSRVHWAKVTITKKELLSSSGSSINSCALSTLRELIYLRENPDKEVVLPTHQPPLDLFETPIS